MLQRRRGVALIVVAALALSPRPAGAQNDRAYVGVFDRDMTPAAGTADLLTIERALADVEDRWLPPLRFEEATLLKHALGIGYRFGKWFGLDLPQDDFLMVVGHEVFGHGARLREIGAGDIRYRFDAPIPYGGGGAVTEFEGDVLVTRADVIGIDTAGIEAQNVLADRIARQALGTGALHYRAAWLYLESRLDGLRYIRSVSPRSPEGHDVAAFLHDFNDQCDPPACTRLTASALKRRALLMLADPLLAYAAYGWAWSYIVRGRTLAALPMIPLPRGMRYLPALHFEMTPYGTALTTEHTIVGNRRLTSVSIGVGDTGRTRAWDLGVAATDVLHRGWLRGDVAANVWRQPLPDATPNFQESRTGGLGAATVRFPIGRRAERTGVLVQIGYKSDGFVRGERLHRGPIFRIGMTFTP